MIRGVICPECGHELRIATTIQKLCLADCLDGIGGFICAKCGSKLRVVAMFDTRLCRKSDNEVMTQEGEGIA